MKKFIVYLLVIVLTVSLGFAVFFLVRDDEVISISASSMYVDKGQNFTIDITHNNKKSYTDVTISTSNEEVVSYDEKTNQFTAHNGGQARINFKTNNSKFRNLACDVIVGDGTLETPYYIDSAEELAAIGMGGQAVDENDVAVTGVTAGAEGYEEYWSNACYKLMADIDVSTINGGYWVPLKAFSGRFDGNGFTISKATINLDKYNELHKDANFSTDNVGLFQEIKAGGLVYNLKLETFGAEGNFVRFGCVAGISYGVIERVEIKSADLKIESSVFGGIAGVIESDDRGSGKTYDRDIARIESCSINFDLTYKPNTLDNRIGGLVGTNNGGTIVYSYANGLVNFIEKDNDLAYYNFGGLVGYNKACEMTETNSEFTIKNQGAHIKDSYANITTKMVAPKSFYSNIGGVIGFNEEISIANQNVGAYGNGYTRLANIFSGVKYNSELLNNNEDGVEKHFGAIGSDADFVESASTIYALNNEQMVDKKNYISCYKFERTYNDDGEFNEAENNGLVEYLWDFSVIWSIDPNKAINSGRPYLNYSILEHLDDFANVGVPVTKDNVYRLVSDTQGTITIVGDSEISLSVDESKYLFLSPYELQHDGLVNWISANSDIVRVEVDGPQVKITGLKPGNVSVMAQTNAGSKASVNVRVVATQNDPLYTMMGEDLYMVENDVIKLSDHFQVFKNNVKQNIALSAFVQSTSNGGKIAIDGDKITAKSQGSVVISVKAGSYITKVYTVNILPDLNKVVVAKLDKTVVELDYEEGKQYECIKVTDIFYSATGEKATGLKFNVVSENGEDFGSSDELMGTFVVWETTESPETYGYYQIAFNVKGVSEQTYRLEIADNTNNLSLQCSTFKIKVVDKSLQGDNYSEFKINKPENGFIVNVGETLKLTTNADKFVNAPAVTWEIHKGENNTYGSLTADGIFKGLSQGQTKVRAYINVNNKKYYDIITITIVPKQINVKLSVKIDNASPIEYVGSNIDVAQGQKVEITAKAYDSNGKEHTFGTDVNDKFKYEVTPVGAPEVTNGVVSGNNNENYSFNLGSSLGYATIKVSIPNLNYSQYVSFTIREKAYLDGYIYNREQLENIRTNLNGTYTIASDIDLSDSPFTPIGTKEAPFTGTLKSLNNKKFVIKGLRVNSTNEYSGLFGYTQGAKIKNITLVGSEGDVIEGKHYVGGLVGYAENTTITDCNIEKYTIKGVYVTDYSEDKGLRVGGMVGHATNGTYIYNCNVSALNLSLSADAEGYLGGLVGYLSTGARVNRAKSTDNTVVATNSKETYVGGLVGFVRGSVTNAQINGASIEGGNAGGLAGEINVEEVVTLEFNVHNKGYRREDIKTFTKASLDVYRISVDNTTIKGNMAGGLFGIIRSGYISDVSIIATIEGVNRKSIKGGIASQIIADEKFTRFGGNGNAGIVECALVVATFKGAGDDYAITSSLVHNWNGKTDTPKGSGYVFNYVFDNDADGKAKYSFGSNDGALNFGNWGDNVKAQKSSEELLKRDTYTDKKFSTLVWNIEDGKLPTLKF